MKTRLDIEPNSEHKSGKSFSEFFAGIGLVRDALETNGWRCLYANDICPKKEMLYKLRFLDSAEFHLDDIWNLSEVRKKLTQPTFLATASFPCVDLSLAGYQKGFKGEHSSAFFGFINAIKSPQSRPQVVLLENVTGFLSANNGSDFESAVTALSKLGYLIDVIQLDAKYFVPQSRPRIFVIAVESSLAKKAEYAGIAALEGGKEWYEVRMESFFRTARIKALQDRVHLKTGWISFSLPSIVPNSTKLSDLIDVGNDQDWWDEFHVEKHLAMMSEPHRAEIEKLRLSKSRFVGTVFRRKREGGTRAEVRFDGVAGCLRTPKGGSAKQIVIFVNRSKIRMRWMTSREYARLQGAGHYPLVENEIQNLFGFGDAVCVPAIRWIDEAILSPLFDLSNGATKTHIHSHNRLERQRLLF